MLLFDCRGVAHLGRIRRRIILSCVTTNTTKKKSKIHLLRLLVVASLKYARRCAKNCVKVLIGRKPSFTRQEVFFQQCLRLGFRIRKVTCVLYISLEGASFQAIYIMWAINFARVCG